jgi:hypothetical protein
MSPDGDVTRNEWVKQLSSDMRRRSAQCKNGIVMIEWPEDVSKSFRTGRLARELQMIELFATRSSCIAIL